VREQSFWTPFGVPGAEAPALINEEGVVEVEPGGFALEPFLRIDGELVTWADAEIAQWLEDGFLPIPSVCWRARRLVLTTTAFAAGDPGRPVLLVRYRLENRGPVRRRVALLAALRPVQVTPAWQAHGAVGGASPIHGLAWRDGAVWVDAKRAVIPLAPPDAFGAAAFEEGSFARQLARGGPPACAALRDEAGLASGALRFDVDLPAGGVHDVFVALPPGAAQRGGAAARPTGGGARALDEAFATWRGLLGRVALVVPERARAWVDALRTATAHVLLNRDGPALQPGPRRYRRAWIRDAATMSAALLRMRLPDPVRDFLRWYAPHQAPDGSVPMCVDRSGPDWLPEHDSHGQLVATVAEHFRLTGDGALLAELWPAARGAVGAIERLRAQRLAPALRTEDGGARYGILPESASHEGYLAHPVHAYWDDFWALRGLGDAADLAHALGDAAEAARIGALRDDLAECLYASIRATIAERGLRYVPASVEWADFDPAATATALATTDAAQRLPADALAFTIDEYVAGFRRRRDGAVEWSRYSAYEIRMAAALVRLGRREEAHELLDFFLGDRRPRAWNQWPEISWRDWRSPGHLGDVPHAWVGAEWVLAVLSLFAYEDPAERALVLCAGLPASWLDGGAAVAVDGLPTWWGRLHYALSRRPGGALVLELGPGCASPPGGIVVRPPLAGPLARVRVNGEPAARFDATSVTLERSPATVVMET
jgi:hypothetical protein